MHGYCCAVPILAVIIINVPYSGVVVKQPNYN